MKRDSHSKLDGNPRRLWQILFLILATTTTVCSTPQKPVRRTVGILAPTAEISIIPQPASITPTTGYFEFSRDIKIIAAHPHAVKASTSLNNILRERYGFTLQVTPD